MVILRRKEVREIACLVDPDLECKRAAGIQMRRRSRNQFADQFVTCGSAKAAERMKREAAVERRVEV